MANELKLIQMSNVPTEEVRWLWYPYVPLGKLTIVQGDPGEGKTTLALAVIASLTRGEPLPDCAALPPMNVIYQTAEDGLADTIKPRLEAMGADCSRVFVIDESRKELSMLDERLEKQYAKPAHGSSCLTRCKRTLAARWTCTAQMRSARSSSASRRWRRRTAAR